MRVVKSIEIESPGLGQRIKQARDADSRTLVSICKVVDMSPANWYRIEDESQVLPIETLRKIEAVLNIDLGVKFD